MCLWDYFRILFSHFRWCLWLRSLCYWTYSR